MAEAHRDHDEPDHQLRSRDRDRVDHQHQRLECRGPWADHHGEAPIIEGTLIQLTVDHLPGDRAPAPVWLWCSTTGATTAEVDHYWSAYLRRFDLEHTFRFLKQTLG
ncbi:MAG: hypothetical protein R2722_00390 [Tessaracoccus sp.]